MTQTGRILAFKPPVVPLEERSDTALQNLPTEQREAFVLCDVEGLGGKEAATVLHVPDGTLYRRLFEARRALRSVLEGL